MIYRLLFGLLVSVLLLAFPGQASAQLSSWIATSPNDDITVTVATSPTGMPADRLYYQIQYGTTVVVPYSPLGITGSAAQTTFTGQLALTGQNVSETNQQYGFEFGKFSTYTDHATKWDLAFTNAAGYQMNLEFHISNNSVSFRYLVPGSGSYQIGQELTGFQVPNTAQKLWVQRFQNNYELPYVERSPSQLSTNEWGMPVLMELPNSLWMLWSEAAVNGQYGSSHLRPNPNSPTQLLVTFAPDELLASTGFPLRGTLPLATPWRVIVVGTLADIVETQVFENLNPPPQTNHDWVKPGRAAWSWWSNHSSPSSLTIQKQYVDFASEMGWEYVLVDEGWSSSWVAELASYAKARNVDIILWYYYGAFTTWTPEAWRPSYSVAANRFQQLKDLGVKGAKIDFFDSDSQNVTQIKEVILQAARDKQMVVNFHGSSKSTGQRRTYPHFLTHEGVEGAEHRDRQAFHTTTLPFTRNVIGPMDYTPVTFSSLGNTTVAHQLAQAVVYESAQQHFADSVEAYNAQPLAKEFLKIVPVTWDETKLLGGYPANHVYLARRKGSDWFVGIMNTQAGTITLPLSFLSGTYNAKLYLNNGTTGLQEQARTNLTSASSVDIPLLANSGAVIHLTYQGGATPTPAPSPTACQKADINSDGVVDLSDYSVLALNFLKTSGFTNPRVDINGDGVVDLTDYSQLAIQFLKTCQ